MFHSDIIDARIKSYTSENGLPYKPDENNFGIMIDAVLNSHDVTRLGNIEFHELLLAIIFDLESQNKLCDMAGAFGRFFWLPNILHNGANDAFNLAKEYGLDSIINIPNSAAEKYRAMNIDMAQTYRDVIRAKYIRTHDLYIRELYHRYVTKIRGDITIDECRVKIDMYLSADPHSWSHEEYHKQIDCAAEYAEFVIDADHAHFDNWFANKSNAYVARAADKIARSFLERENIGAAFCPMKKLYDLCQTRFQALEQCENNELTHQYFIMAIFNMQTALGRYIESSAPKHADLVLQL
jgi:hypothetical protein